MSSHIKRMLRIINITPERALKEHNIPNILQFIDDTCSKVLKRILENPNNQISSQLTRVDRTRSDLLFKTNKFKTNAYRDSFVQKALRTIRDNGKTNLYINKNSTYKPNKKTKTKTLSTTSEVTSNPTGQCPYCSHKPFKGLKCLSNHIANKHSMEKTHS